MDDVELTFERLGDGSRPPDDLIAPFNCACGTRVLIPAKDVVEAVVVGSTLPCSGCDRVYHVRDLSAITMFSRAEWEAGVEGGQIQSYVVQHAFQFPL